MILKPSADKDLRSALRISNSFYLVGELSARYADGGSPGDVLGDGESCVAYAGGLTRGDVATEFPDAHAFESEVLVSLKRFSGVPHLHVET
jgi:hypothetical protein